MKIQDELFNKFGNKINKVYFETENSHNFLRVELNLNEMNAVVALSREISAFLDTVEFSENDFILDIFSAGAEINIETNKLDGYVGENINVELIKEIKGKKSFEGELISLEEDTLNIKWNAKGQFRKQNINFSEVDSINLSLKVRKGK
ncbi:MAG: hypothetical protein KAG04_01095 [Mycoplasmataceae bacterium]|nr:hypothetical protein [Mycoplasmataceae bacterium]